MSRQPFIGSGRPREAGAGATRKQDFNAHVAGTDFRQKASTVDVVPIPNVSGTTVQETLESLHDIITSAGSGFVSIGSTDGYAQGSYNVGADDTPTLFDAFAAAFANDRLQDGGVVLLLAGTYTLTNTVVVPAGITILGETAGSIIIGQTPDLPIFTALASSKPINIGGDSGSGSIAVDKGSFSEQTRFQNLMLFDNLGGVANSGNATMITSPMIRFAAGANVVCENVSFIGRINDGAVSGRQKTLAALASNGAGTATSLTVRNCFIDGTKIGIKFIPAAGSSDRLVVSGCRARTYGTEDGGATNAVDNSFIVATYCNADINNNHHIGAGSQVKTFLDFESGGSATNCKIVVVGNTGNPVSDVTGTLVKNTGAQTFKSIVSGNNYGVFVDNPWYIVVGGADGDAPLGDIFGPNAINTVLLMASTAAFEATVIVNPGTYTVTGDVSANNWANLKFIGNKKGKQYPVFELNLTSTALDGLGNRFLTLGNSLQSIYFKSINSFQSIRVSYSPTSPTAQSAAHLIEVKDCVFIDTTLNSISTAAGPFTDQNGIATKLSINISNCQFKQTGAFNDSVGLSLPNANIIEVSDCEFSGYGYGASIVKPIGSADLDSARYCFRNVTMDLTGFTINDAAPSDVYGYLTIADDIATVTLQSCTITADSTLDSVTTTIDAGLASSFTTFCYLQGREISINDCVINGPTQTFTSAAVDYALPTVYCEPAQSIRVTNNRFVNGGLPLQIGGGNSFSETVLGDGIFISGNQFISSATTVTGTLLDIDVDPDSTITPRCCLIQDNNFRIYSVASGATTNVLHTEATDRYDTHAMVQVFAHYFDVKFCNNVVTGFTVDPASNTFNNFAGLVINNYNSTSGTDGAVLTNVSVTGSSFYLTNLFAAALLQSCSCVKITSSLAIVTNNYMGMQNTTVAGAGFVGNLHLNIFASAFSSYGASMVSGNIFSRRRQQDAAATILALGYCYIDHSSTRGMIVNNEFSDATIDNVSDTTVVYDNTSSNGNWIVTNNINQTCTLVLPATTGTISLGLASNTNKTVVGLPLGVTASQVAILYSATSTLLFDYNDTATDQIMLWHIPVTGYIPQGAYIVSVSCPVDISANPSTTSIAKLTLQNSTVSSNNTINPLTTSGGTLTLSPATNVYRSRPEERTSIQISMEINGASTSDFTADAITVTYRW